MFWDTVTTLLHTHFPLKSNIVVPAWLPAMSKLATMLTDDVESTTIPPELETVDGELMFKMEEERKDIISCKLIFPPHVTFEEDVKVNGCPLRSIAFPTPYVMSAAGKVTGLW